MNISQELQDVKTKLESVEEENKMLKLQKIEYEKEICDLKHQKEILTDENDSFSQLIKRDQQLQQELSYSRSLSQEILLINSENEDLIAQMSLYQNLIKRLNTTNKTLQTENKNYTLLLQQLSAENQQKHKIHNETIMKLENRIKELENEYETVRDHLNTCNNTLQIQTYPSAESNKSESAGIFRLMSVMTARTSTNGLYHELHLPSSSYSKNYDDIISQLVNFGYNESDIMAAINKIDGDVAISKVVEMLDSETTIATATLRVKYNDIEMKLRGITVERNELRQINQKNKTRINRLQKRIKYLKQTINELKMKKEMNDKDVECKWSQWLRFI